MFETDAEWLAGGRLAAGKPKDESRLQC